MIPKDLIVRSKNLGLYCKSIDAFCEECEKITECKKYLKTISNLTPCGIFELINIHNK